VNYAVAVQRYKSVKNAVHDTALCVRKTSEETTKASTGTSTAPNAAGGLSKDRLALKIRGRDDLFLPLIFCPLSKSFALTVVLSLPRGNN